MVVASIKMVATITERLATIIVIALLLPPANHQPRRNRRLKLITPATPARGVADTESSMVRNAMGVRQVTNARFISGSQPAANDPSIDPVLTFILRYTQPVALIGMAFALTAIAWALSL